MPKSDFIIKDNSSLLVIGTDDGIKIAKRIIRKKYRPEELNYV